MNDLVSIIITTFDKGDGSRTGPLTNTVQAMCNGLPAAYPELFWILADDGSPEQDKHLAPAKKVLEDFNQIYTVTNSERGGVGKSKNLALAEAFDRSPFVLLSEDDWLLTRPFNLYPYIRVLSEYSEIGMIRLGYLGGTMTASYLAYNDISFWDLHQGSGVYIYSGQVSLRHRRFYDICGYHPEGISPGEEELEYCKHYNGVENAPKILWPATYGCTLNAPFIPFVNVGMDVSTNAIQPGELNESMD